MINPFQGICFFWYFTNLCWSPEIRLVFREIPCEILLLIKKLPKITQKYQSTIPFIDGRNPAPVEVGSLSDYPHGLQNQYYAILSFWKTANWSKDAKNTKKSWNNPRLSLAVVHFLPISVGGCLLCHSYAAKQDDDSKSGCKGSGLFLSCSSD